MNRLLSSLTLAVALAVAPRAFTQEIKETNSLEEKSGVTAFALSPDGKSLAFADNDSELLLRPVNGTRRLLLGQHSAPFLSLAFSPDGKKLAGLTRDKVIHLFTIGVDAPAEKLKVDADGGLVAIDSEGKVLLAHVVTGRTGDDNFAEVRLLDVRTGKHRVVARATTPFALPGVAANFRLLTISADGKALAVSTSDPGGTLSQFLVHTATGARRNIPASMRNDSMLALSQGGVILVAAGNGGLQCWNYAAAEVTASAKVSPRLAAISADGRTLVAVGAQNVVTTHELPDSNGKPDPKRINANRLKGMKEAVADLEKGSLKQKMIPPPAPPWWEAYVALLKKECGIEIVYVVGEESPSAMASYNAVMMLEIEHRFGQGILQRLGKRATDEHVRAGQTK